MDRIHEEIWSRCTSHIFYGAHALIAVNLPRKPRFEETQDALQREERNEECSWPWEGAKKRSIRSMHRNMNH